MNRENDSQAITNILVANLQHLELLHLDLIYRDERGPLFLPPNLKYLCVRNYCHGDEVLAELVAEQCPKLCGLRFRGQVTLRTIAAISRFEKFVLPL